MLGTGSVRLRRPALPGIIRCPVTDTFAFATCSESKFLDLRQGLAGARERSTNKRFGQHDEVDSVSVTEMIRRPGATLEIYATCIIRNRPSGIGGAVSCEADDARHR